MRLPWRRPAAPTTTIERRPLRWLEVDAHDTDRLATAVDDIFARRLDGMTIAGVYTADECRRAVAALDASDHPRLPTMFGRIIGPPVSMRPDPDPGPEDRTAYLDEADRCRALQTEAFGFDPFDRVADAVGPMAAGRHLGPPVEGDRRYASGNVRWYEPGKPGLPSHVGNEFPMHRDNSLWHLRQIARTEDHLSWFVVLQPPDEGGALSVFDLLFEDERPDVPDWGNDGRPDGPFDSVPATKIRPDAGGMVLFGGGWRWHRVDPIPRGTERVTYGGFACKSHDDRSLYFWM